MKAIAYTRCSTQEQSDSGLGLDVQAERVHAYCAMRNMTLEEMVMDAGVSGGKPLAKRTGGAKLLEIIRRERVDAVVMLKLDRMFRNEAEQRVIREIHTMRSAGKTLAGIADELTARGVPPGVMPQRKAPQGFTPLRLFVHHPAYGLYWTFASVCANRFPDCVGHCRPSRVQPGLTVPK